MANRIQASCSGAEANDMIARLSLVASSAVATWALFRFAPHEAMNTAFIGAVWVAFCVGLLALVHPWYRLLLASL